jgi:hypothetical protein
MGLAEVSRQLGEPARRLSDLVFQGAVDASTWPRAAGHLLVPAGALPAIKQVIAARRRLKYAKGKGQRK